MKTLILALSFGLLTAVGGAWATPAKGANCGKCCVEKCAQCCGEKCADCKGCK